MIFNFFQMMDRSRNDGNTLHPKYSLYSSAILHLLKLLKLIFSGYWQVSTLWV